MRFYIVKDGTRQGPYEVEELMRQRLSPDTLVWTKGMPEWIEASRVPELAAAIDSDVPSMPGDAPAAGTGQAPIGETVPPPLYGDESKPESQQPAGYAGEQQYDNAYRQQAPGYGYNRPATGTTQPEKPKKRNLTWVVVLCVLAVIALLVCTKPSRDSHLEAIDAACYDYLSESVDSSLIGGLPGIADGAKSLMNTFINTAIEQHFELHDYFLWNVGKFTYNGREKTVSVGILGHVFTFDKEDLADAVKKYAEEHRAQPTDDGSGDNSAVLQEAVDAAKEAVGKVVSRVDTTGLGEKVDSATNAAIDHATDEAVKQARKAGESLLDELEDEIKKYIGNGNGQ